MSKHITLWTLLLLSILLGLLQSGSIIPSSAELIKATLGLYENAPLLYLSIGVATSVLVYINIYFPGALFIVAAIFASSGTFREFLFIALVTSVIALISNIGNYYFGRYLQVKKPPSRMVSVIALHLSLHTLGYYYLYSEFTSRVKFAQSLILSTVFLVPYSILFCYLLYPLSESIREEIIWCISLCIVIYLVYSYYTDQKEPRLHT